MGHIDHATSTERKPLHRACSEQRCNCPAVHTLVCIGDNCEVLECDQCGGEMPECSLYTTEQDECVCARCATPDEYENNHVGCE
jgi:hypothetical protein